MADCLVLRTAWVWAQECLAEVGIAEARLEARFLVQAVTGCRYADFLADGERPLSAAAQIALQKAVDRRSSGEPLAYVLERADFRALSLRVTPAVLVPRADTEILVDCALARLLAWPTPRILDLGTGSGAVALALAQEWPSAKVAAVDVSPTALAVAQENALAHALTVEFCLGDWFAPVAGRQFEMIVSNPPYIAEEDPHLAGDGLPFEPRLALTDGVAGGDGLACVRRIVAAAPLFLVPGGWLLLEHGHDQGASCRNLLTAAGFQATFTAPDLGGLDRVSGGQIGF